MTSTEQRRQAEALARQAIADLPTLYVDTALRRAVGQTVVVWANLTVHELHDVYASARRLSLVLDCP